MSLQKYTLIFLCILSILLSYTPVLADPKNAKPHKMNPESIWRNINSLGTKLGHSSYSYSDPKALDALKSHTFVFDQTGFNNRIQDNYDALEEKEQPLKIIQHIRSNNGIPFPKPGSFPFPGGPNIEIPREQLNAVAEFGAQEMMKLKELPKLPEMPKCEKDFTKKDTLGEGETIQGKDSNFALFDILFVEEESLDNAHEVFGVGTIVVPYQSNKPNPLALLSQHLGVDCLPYRIRVASRYIYRDRGLPALMNYDSNPTGKGVFHKSLKERFSKQKKNRR